MVGGDHFQGIGWLQIHAESARRRLREIEPDHGLVVIC